MNSKNNTAATQIMIPGQVDSPRRTVLSAPLITTFLLTGLLFMFALAGCGGGGATASLAGTSDLAAFATERSAASNAQQTQQESFLPAAKATQGAIGTVTGWENGSSFLLTPPSAPGQTPHAAIHVNVPEGTAVVTESGETASLENGVPVRVEGHVDLMANTVTADRIIVVSCEAK